MDTPKLMTECLYSSIWDVTGTVAIAEPSLMNEKEFLKDQNGNINGHYWRKEVV